MDFFALTRALDLLTAGSLDGLCLQGGAFTWRTHRDGGLQAPPHPEDPPHVYPCRHDLSGTAIGLPPQTDPQSTTPSDIGSPDWQSQTGRVWLEGTFRRFGEPGCFPGESRDR